MAYESDPEVETFTAEEDLSAKQFYFVKQGTAETGVLLNDTAGGPVLGVLQNKPTSGQMALVAISGTSKCSFNASVAAGLRATSSSDAQLAAASALTVDSSGQSATAASTGSFVVGVVRENGGEAGGIGSVELDFQGAVAGTAA